MPEVLGMIHVHRKTPLPAALALVIKLALLLYKVYNYFHGKGNHHPTSRSSDEEASKREPNSLHTYGQIQ